MILAFEGRQVSRILAILDIDVLAGGVIGPAVIGADMIFSVALLGAAQDRALMAANIDEGAEDALGVAHQQYWRAADMRSDVVVGLDDLRFKGEEIPAALKNEFLLELENLRIGIDVAMQAKDAVFRPIVDVERHIPRCHEPPLP